MIQKVLKANQLCGSSDNFQYLLVLKWHIKILD